MPRRSVIHLSTEQSSRGIARAYLYDVDVDRQKHIDRYIDYFGGGAAGSLIVILLRIYYSAQVVFFGAEFTKVYSRRFGAVVVPDKLAVPLTTSTGFKPR